MVNIIELDIEKCSFVKRTLFKGIMPFCVVKYSHSTFNFVVLVRFFRTGLTADLMRNYFYVRKCKDSLIESSTLWMTRLHSK